MPRFPLTPDEFAQQRASDWRVPATRKAYEEYLSNFSSELLYAIESPDGSKLYYQAETLEGILNAAACMRDDFPGCEFVVLKGGEYDGQATLQAQEGLFV